eukprot:scaffold803_cov310-Pinguiococcus_pyrenoidosus.AAC.200
MARVPAGVKVGPARQEAEAAGGQVRHQHDAAEQHHHAQRFQRDMLRLGEPEDVLDESAQVDEAQHLWKVQHRQRELVLLGVVAKCQRQQIVRHHGQQVPQEGGVAIVAEDVAGVATQLAFAVEAEAAAAEVHVGRAHALQRPVKPQERHVEVGEGQAVRNGAAAVEHHVNAQQRPQAAPRVVGRQRPELLAAGRGGRTERGLAAVDEMAQLIVSAAVGCDVGVESFLPRQRPTVGGGDATAPVLEVAGEDREHLSAQHEDVRVGGCHHGDAGVGRGRELPVLFALVQADQALLSTVVAAAERSEGQRLRGVPDDHDAPLDHEQLHAALPGHDQLVLGQVYSSAKRGDQQLRHRGWSPFEEWHGCYEGSADAAAELLLQQHRQLLKDLLLRHVALAAPNVLKVAMRLFLQLRREVLLDQREPHLRDMLAPAPLALVHAVHKRRQATDERREHHCADEHQGRDVDGLQGVPRRNVAVAHRGHGHQRKVNGAEVDREDAEGAIVYAKAARLARLVAKLVVVGPGGVRRRHVQVPGQGCRRDEEAAGPVAKQQEHNVEPQEAPRGEADLRNRLQDVVLDHRGMSRKLVEQQQLVEARERQQQPRRPGEHDEREGERCHKE